MRLVNALSLLLALPPAATATGFARSSQEVLDWHSGTFAAAQNDAREAGELLLVYFWMDGSEFCRRLYGDTLTAASVESHVAGLLAYSAKATEAEGAKLVQRYGVNTLPTILFLTPEGTAEDAILGYIGPAGFGAEVDRIRAGQNTVSAMRAACAAAPDDLALRARLATKLDVVGDRAGSVALLESIQRDDPRGDTVIGAQLFLYDELTRVRAEAEDASDPATYDLGPLYAHVRKITPPAVAFEGWSWIADNEYARGEHRKARRAAVAAWEHVPAEALADFGSQVVQQFWTMREELTGREKSFVLDVAQAVVERARELASGTEEVERAGEMTAYLAARLDDLARCYHINRKRSLALEAVRESLAIDPGVAEHQTLLDFLEGRGQ